MLTISNSETSGIHSVRKKGNAINADTPLIIHSKKTGRISVSVFFVINVFRETKNEKRSPKSIIFGLENRKIDLY